MSDSQFDPVRPQQPAPYKPGTNTERNSSNGWLPWRRPGHDSPGEDTSEPVPSRAAQGFGDQEATPAEPVPDVLETAGAHTSVHGDVEVVAHRIEHLIMETRKQDLLEGVELDRGQLLKQPFVRDPQWAASWEQAIDPATGRLLQPVLIIVAPRSFGSTTFALRLLAEHTSNDTRLLKLDADWSAPKRGGCPWRKRTPSSSTSRTRATTNCRPTSSTHCPHTPRTSGTVAPTWS
ncbi:hypothetical protein SSPO_001430 [Streptomyces antimycoticus]|uniref:Uncharacterized protein n=1 Tax=Streptomyces antimycoticus TaxID=68175 RepID=A0A499UA31_9ACTN|nr:hypothetical protein [Streptomyces antimycoticus]BBJ37425.1 hypothetical protein SSPO_001430 [Streptomyces antimycoticus]